MDEWIEQNPRATLYILAVSVLLIIILSSFLWYYTTSQAYMKMVDRELLKEVVEHLRDKKDKHKAENLTEIADGAKESKKSDDDFTIIDV